MASMGVLRFHQINVMPHIISFSTLLAPVHISLISNVEIIVMTKKGIVDDTFDIVSYIKNVSDDTFDNVRYHTASTVPRDSH